MEGLDPCLLPRPRHWRPSRSYLCRHWGGRERQLSIMVRLMHVSTVRRQSSSVSAASNGWDDRAHWLCHAQYTTLGSKCAFAWTFLHIGKNMCNVHLCFAGRVVRVQEGPERRPFCEERMGKDRNRDCSELIIHKPPFLAIRTVFS